MNNAQLINDIKNTAQEYWLLFSKTYNCGLIPTIEYTNNKTAIAGKAYLRSGRVSFNLRFALEKDFHQTIAHELAHIIQARLYPNASQAHGPEFRAILSTVSNRTSTYHRYSVAAAKALKVNKIMPYDLISADEM